MAYYCCAATIQQRSPAKHRRKVRLNDKRDGHHHVCHSDKELVFTHHRQTETGCSQTAQSQLAYAVNRQVPSNKVS